MGTRTLDRTEHEKEEEPKAWNTCRCRERPGLELLCFETDCLAVHCPIYFKESGLLAQNINHRD